MPDDPVHPRASSRSSRDPTRAGPWIVPVLWCFVGSQAAVLLGVPPDLALIVAGGVGVVAMLGSRHPEAASA